MAAWKQLVLTLIVLGGAIVAWVAYVPSALPMLERTGLMERLEQAGLPVPRARPGTGAESGGEGSAPGTAVVLAAAPGTGIVNDSVAAIGNGQAVRSVVVTPEVPGRIALIEVASGEQVRAGQVIARLESEAEEIAVERAALVLDDAQVRNERVTRLRAAGTATDIQIREAELGLRQAELALRQARFDLSRRILRAPIAGWVGILHVEIGQQVSAASEITRIDDRSEILVEFRVPERFVGLIGRGDHVAARPLARTDTMLEGVVSAVDNRVDETSRTMLLQARLDNSGDALRAGMAFAITLSLPGETRPAVDPLSVQWGSEGAFVWVVRDGRAGQVPVRIIQRSARAVLVEARFEPSDKVVIEGVQALRPGMQVTVRTPRGDGSHLPEDVRAGIEASKI
ncbi:MAG: efflux RND transporter periplasmic adaptor subunit [Gemmobacter sp.]